MPKITVYTMNNCPYCESAKSLLKQRGVSYQEIRVANDDDGQWEALYKLSGMRTMPQVFADDQLIGGYTDLAEQDQKDSLASLK